MSHHLNLKSENFTLMFLFDKRTVNIWFKIYGCMVNNFHYQFNT